MVRGRTNLPYYGRFWTVTSPVALAVFPARSVAVTDSAYVPVFFGAVQASVLVPRPYVPGLSVATRLLPSEIVTAILEIFESLKRSFPDFLATSVRGSTDTTGAVVRYWVKCCAALQYWIVVVRLHSCARKSRSSVW